MAVPKKKHTRSRSNQRRNAKRSQKARVMLQRAETAYKKAQKA